MLEIAGGVILGGMGPLLIVAFSPLFLAALGVVFFGSLLVFWTRSAVREVRQDPSVAIRAVAVLGFALSSAALTAMMIELASPTETAVRYMPRGALSIAAIFAGAVTVALGRWLWSQRFAARLARERLSRANASADQP